MSTNEEQTNEVNRILDISAGTWSVGPSETTPEADSSSNVLGNGAVVQACSGCYNGYDVGYIGGPPGGTWTFEGISSTVSTITTIRIYYANGDSTQRYANVVVNGVTNVVPFLLTGNGMTTGTSTLTVLLNSGTRNVIESEAYNGG